MGWGQFKCLIDMILETEEVEEAEGDEVDEIMMRIKIKASGK